MFRTGSKCSGDLPPSRVSLSPATSSLSIGDKVIVLVGGRGHAGRSWRPSAPSPQVGGGVVAVLNAPLLGHNPSQWPRNPGLLVTAMCLVHCNSIVTFCCNSKCTIVHFCLHLKDQSSTYTIKKSRRSLCSIFWCFPDLSEYPHCSVYPHCLVCIRRVKSCAGACALKLHRGVLVTGTNSRQSTPSFMGGQ